MSSESSTRLLSIGEFAAATQLSPKALRLYDEQQLLQPARIDSASGYRYYRHDQVATGRLIRTLRDMDLSLADVARVIAARGGEADRLLREFASSLDQRYAREKRAFHAALLLLGGGARAETPEIQQMTRPQMTLLVQPFVTNRRHFYGRLEAELRKAAPALAQDHMHTRDECYIRLLEPLSDEETMVELLLPTQTSVQLPPAATVRQAPACVCATSAANMHSSEGPDFSAPTDAIFDWFDRLGHLAVDVPWLHRVAQGANVHTRLEWAFEPAGAGRK